MPKQDPANGIQDANFWRAELASRIAAHVHEEGEHVTGMEGVTLYRRSHPTACTSAAYMPRLILCAQGEKRIYVGATTYVYDGTTFVLNTIDLPVMSQVTIASPEAPFLGMLIKLDMPSVREILSQHEFPLHEDTSGTRGMAIGVTPPELLSACCRLMDLLETPQDIPFLSSLLQREILYRLLRTPQGRHLRAIATLGEQSQRLSKTVEWLRQNYAKPLRVEELANMARMGVSTLHHQFRSLTAMSPLQYQKQLRLHVARERMLNEGIDAASAAFEVGYESASQFNREYSRFFGQPPMRDIKTRLLTTVALQD
jgi:AraC-like DNA-binding protein